MWRISLFIFLSLPAGRIYAQSGLTIVAGTPFYITSGSTVAIDGLALTPTTGFTISAPNSLSRNSTITNTTTGTYIKRVFKWANTLSTFTGSVALYYQDAELNGLTETDLVLELYNGSIWVPYLTGTTGDATNNVVTTTGISNQINELTLASKLLLLPVRWGPVLATRQNGSAIIEWNTDNEENLDFYETEKSLDGTNWVVFGGRQPAFNTPVSHRYTQQDPAVTSAKTLYRVRLTDKDGKISNSAVAYINALAHAYTINLYPNPSLNSLTIQSQGLPITRLRIYTIEGKLVRIENAGSLKSFQTDISNLPAGQYLLQPELSDGSTTPLPFIKN